MPLHSYSLNREISGLEDYPDLENEHRAFVAWCLLEIAAIDEEELIDSIVDGSDDKGIGGQSRSGERD